jgi:glycosyltransferase involved in cell wall biosynthesis
MGVTIAIPFYNAEDFLADAIRSVFAQTYENWELILINDGSTDGSLKIAESVKDSRVRVYSDGKNKKLASRLNEVISLAKYDFIARMDADDLMSPMRIQRQMEIFEQYPDKDIVSTGVCSITNDNSIIGSRGCLANGVSLNDLLYKRIGILHAAVIARKSWYKRNNYNPLLKVAQDYELWLQSCFNNDLHIFLLDEPLYYYREEGNVTEKKMLLAYNYERQAYKRYAGSDCYILTIKSYIKTLIVKLLSSLNSLDFLLKKRSSAVVDKNIIKQFQRDFSIIKNTKVSGLVR